MGHQVRVVGCLTETREIPINSSLECCHTSNPDIAACFASQPAGESMNYVQALCRSSFREEPSNPTTPLLRFRLAFRLHAAPDVSGDLDFMQAFQVCQL
jgi:hypothetical protein